MIALVVVASALPASDTELDDLLDQASESEVVASWQDTRLLLERIEPLLPNGNARHHARFTILKARNYALSGRIDEGLALLDELLESSLERGERLRSLELGANLAMLIGDYETSFTYLNRGLGLEFDQDSSREWIGFLSLASYIYAQVGRYDLAVEYGNRAVSLAEASEPVRAKCISTQRLGYVYKASARHAEAEEFYRRALAYCTESGDSLLIGVVRYGLADLLRISGRHEAAERLFEQALLTLDENGYATGRDEARLYYAMLQFDLGRLARAEELLAEVAEPLREQENWVYYATVQLKRSEIARENGNLERALDLMSDGMAARETYLANERAMRLAFAEVEFDTRFTEQENALLRQQNQVARLEERSRRQQTRLNVMASGFGVFLLVVMVLLLVHTRRERRHYQRLSRRDGLTGLHNHTRFFESTDMRIEEAGRRDKPLALVLADIDYFKQVNDRHGHLAGDQVLRQTAACLSESFGGDATVGRIGGEEFGICIADCSATRAQQRVDSLRQRLRQMADKMLDEPVTMSFGIAILKPDESLENLRGRADQALYRAKHQGRDRVVLAEDDPNDETSSPAARSFVPGR